MEFEQGDFLRELAKHNIVSSHPELGNYFNKAIRTAIKKLQEDMSKAQANYALACSKPYSEGYLKTGVPNASDMVILDEQMDFGYSNELIGESLSAIAEMRIVNFYKSYEICIKSTINTAYGKVDRNIFQWDAQKDFFNNLDIKIAEIPGYNELNQLRTVNNCIKHQETFDQQLKKIKEFSDLDRITHDSCELFYKRIEKPINDFVSVLSEKIYADRFEFNDERLNKLALEYKYRMDKNTFALFIEKLKS
ncbi:MAG: hypothetical protein EOO93_09170 [Pedobacter sp.]|nr:MAG: hypothetical protein EOO93_09170 [Pedobacter sp.]